MSKGDIQALGNWSDPAMVDRYTSSVRYEDYARHYKSPLDSLLGKGDQSEGLLAGGGGFEPPLTDSESAVLPLD